MCPKTSAVRPAQEQPIGLYIQGIPGRIKQIFEFDRQQFGLKAKTQPKLFLAHVRRNRHLKKNIIALKDNEGENLFTPSAQAELLKNFYSSRWCKTHTNSAHSNGRDASAAVLNSGCA